MQYRQATLALGLVILSSCASIRVRPIQNNHGSKGIKLESKDAGVHFYRPAPFLHIGKAKEGFVMQIVMLPDLTKEYVVTWKSGMGSVSPKFSLEDGWNLVSFDSSVDSKLAEVLESTAGALTAVKSNSSSREPGLYKLEWHDVNKTWFVGKNPVFEYGQ